jgi:fibronectin type 3 domain-containing protein
VVPPLPRKLTPQPLATTTWRDSAVEVGTERCYAVRTVETRGTSVIESEPSPVLCISPTDTFPPKAPTNLAAVASEGAISLIWEANTEADLAGYIVLRGEAPGATLAPLMTEPIKDTTYRDTTTKAGVRYVYTVVAVDTATPQNVSTQSNRVEETAR